MIKGLLKFYIVLLKKLRRYKNMNLKSTNELIKQIILYEMDNDCKKIYKSWETQFE